MLAPTFATQRVAVAPASVLRFSSSLFFQMFLAVRIIVAG